MTYGRIKELESKIEWLEGRGKELESRFEKLQFMVETIVGKEPFVIIGGDPDDSISSRAQKEAYTTSISIGSALNLIRQHRTDQAIRVLETYEKVKGSKKHLGEVAI